MNKEFKERLEFKIREAAKKGDFETKSRMLVEESSEYIQAWCKLKREDYKGDAWKDFVSEFADVLCVALQLVEIVGEDVVYKEMDRKLERYLVQNRVPDPFQNRMKKLMSWNTRLRKPPVGEEDLEAIKSEDEEDFNAQMF